MERNEISIHEVRVYRALKANGAWMTVNEIKDAAAVARRTAALHCKRFVTLGLCDLAEVFPAHRYRWAEKASKRNLAYVQRLDGAAEALSAK